MEVLYRRQHLRMLAFFEWRSGHGRHNVHEEHKCT